MNSDVYLAYATCPDQATAERIAETLVNEGLVRCANIQPPHLAIYTWEGRVERAREVGVIFKFAGRHRETLAQRFLDLHPFDTPALVYLPVDGGAAEFLAWVTGK